MASHHHQHRRKTKHRHGSVHNGQSNDSQNDEFLVFGYSAKLHNPRDEHRPAEEQQQPFDESLYLIPWNGDDRLKIDRYDVRLYLSSLDEFDEEKQRKRSIADIGAAEEEEDTAEKLEEELCEEERFLDLYEDIRKRELEEANQKSGKGAEIGFTYEEGETDKIDMVGECEETTAEDEQPYEQPQSLKLPVGIVTPETMKQNALIERTAQFVVAQGPQMEVVIKAKQRQNAEQFGFLDFDHRLHPYYKYMCKLIREKKYVPQPKQQLTKKRIVEELSESDTDTENEGDGYLHPSLLGGMSRAKAGEDALSPQPGFIGPSPRPPPQKVERKPASPGPDLDVLVQQFHRSSSGNSLYSSLLKGLHSVLPGTSPKVENTVKLEVEPPQTHIDEPISKVESMGIPSLFESDQQQRTDDYNKWHMEFYGRPSPFLPGHPPVCQRPVPDSAVESAISVAAKYVALHGAYAEQRLIEHNQDKVHFLQARSPYYTFYQSQVRQIQWKIFQQSQQNRQQPFHAPQLFTTPFGNIAAVPSPPPPSVAELVKVPSDRQMADTVEKGEEGMELKEAEPDSKQLERREKARLFMERILNERMAEKRRTKTNNKPNEEEEEDKRGTVSETASTSAAASVGGVAVQPLPSSALSPLALSKAISCLIDEQIKRTLGTSPPQAPAEARKKKREKRREGEERRRRRKKRRTRSYSSESSSSFPSSSTDSNEEERSRKRRRRRKNSKRRKRGREHGSESDSSDHSGGEEEEKRRKRKQKGQEEGDSRWTNRARRSCAIGECERTFAINALL